jgi:heat shock protein HslJ
MQFLFVVLFLAMALGLGMFTLTLSPDENPLVGEWQVVSLEGAPVPKRLAMTFGGRGSELQLSGNAGCNRFTGTARVNSNSLSFSPLATTRRACVPQINQFETRFLKALSEVDGFDIVNHQLTLSSAGEGKIVLEKANQQQ